MALKIPLVSCMRNVRSISIRAHGHTPSFLLFPGQGAQFIGMAHQATTDEKMRQKFLIASDILEFDLLEACNKGKKEFLDATEISQPAIFVTSMACMEQLIGAVPDVLARCSLMMGLSLGEYSALCCAGAFSFEDGVRLTRARGKAMQEASKVVPSGMISIVGLSLKSIIALCQTVADITDGKPLWIANYLGDMHFTLCGSREACDAGRFLTSAPPPGATWSKSRAIPLSVSGAFHSSFMQPAVAPLRCALDAVVINPLRTTVVSNVDGSPHSCSNSENIKAKLLQQLIMPVQWVQCMNLLVETAAKSSTPVDIFEVGPGTVCAGILKRMNYVEKVKSVSIS